MRNEDRFPNYLQALKGRGRANTKSGCRKRQLEAPKRLYSGGTWFGYRHTTRYEIQYAR